MKIFPPLSEMLWPKGWTLLDVISGWRYPLLGLIGVVCGVSFWAIADTPRLSSKNAGPLLVSGTSCSSLILDQQSTATTSQPCKTFRLASGASIAANRALERSALPPRDGQLTAADHAIKPPPKTVVANPVEPQISSQTQATPSIRRSVFDEAISPAQLMSDATSTK